MVKTKEKPYYTDGRARRSISLNDTSGQNAISYDQETGALAFTGIGDDSIRSAFSGGTGVDITDGEVSIGQSVGDTDDVTFATLTSNILTLNVGAEPTSPANGNIAMADGTLWDPNLDGSQALMVYINGAWEKIL